MPGRHPNPRYYASPSQVSYLRHLLHLAFSRQVVHGLRLDPRRLETLSRVEAGSAIDALSRVLYSKKQSGEA